MGTDSKDKNCNKGEPANRRGTGTLSIELYKITYRFFFFFFLVGERSHIVKKKKMKRLYLGFDYPLNLQAVARNWRI